LHQLRRAELREIRREDEVTARDRVLVLLRALLAAVLIFSTCAALAQNRHRRHFGPPWDAPVASSQTFHIAGATLRVDFAPGPLDLPRAQYVAWVRRAATAVATYYGRFPVPHDRILIRPVPGADGVLSGATWGNVGGFPAFHFMRVGQHTTADQLIRDWTMTHELVHTAFPNQRSEHHWIEEGIAVYVEPVARVQARFLHPEKIWWDMMRDMPKGNPQPGDEGLDRTHTWGRTYWGGAQFCLLADVMIREKTHNRKGLVDALRGILAAGGAIDRNWPLRKAFRVGDRATGTHVLERLYRRMADKPGPVDLAALWEKLGVVRKGNGVRFDNSAPEADIRIAITRTPSWGSIHPEP
jgi:hypothetical protein